MDSSKLKALLILAIALCFALYLGIAAATAQVEILAWVGGGLFITICLLLGRHIWILIPATLGMQGSFNFIPGSPAPWHLMTAVACAFTLLRVFTRQQRLRFRWTGMETAILLVALTILQAFLRNPTGLMILGGSISGGKPYIVYCVAITAYFVVAMANADLRSWRWAVICFIPLTLLDATINIISAYSPGFAGTMIRFYSNVSFTAANEVRSSINLDENRITEFGALGVLLGTMATTLWRPTAALDFRKPWRACIALGAIAATLLGGFRGAAGRLIIDFSLGSLLRRKFLDVLVVGGVGIVMISVLSIAVPINTLPFSIQRLLTVLPGMEVEARIAKDAEGSNDFRFEMWKLALTTDRYIQNKLLGDGFQYSSSEMAARTSMMYGDYRMTGGMTTEEMFMATGSYHGFHAETIRFTGVVGLIAATTALVVFAVFANRCIRFYRNQPIWGMVLFVCMPFLLHPIWYWLVFGDYRDQFAVLIASAGLLKLLYELALRQDAEQKAANSIAMPQPPAGS